MIFNRYKGIRHLIQRGKIWRKLMYVALKPRVQRSANLGAEGKSLFTQVEIETINRCNGTCPFCPVNAHADTRVRAEMTEELFHSIVDQLAQMDYKGSVCLFSNNEPFLDKRIQEFSEYMREKLPHAFIHLYTNGTLLTVEKVKAIMPYLDRLIIDNYNDDLELLPSVKPIHELCQQDKELDQKIHIHLRKLNEVLYTRGGQSPNNQKKKTFKMPCQIASQQLIIRPTGLVSLCSNDALGVYTMGDCNTTPILDIWYGEKFMEIRRKLAKGREGLELCEFCDTFSPD